MNLPKQHVRPLKTALRKSLAAILCLWFAAWQAYGAESSAAANEYQVKAVCLYNFTRFTDWPASSFAASNAPIVIGIVGEDPFGKMIDAVVNGEVVRGHPLTVKRLGANESLLGCHIIFFCHSEKKHFQELLKRIRGGSVLSVGEVTGFAEQGGMVNLIVADKTVKVEINQVAAEQAGLQISSKLLKLARIVLNNPDNSMEKP